MSLLLINISMSRASYALHDLQATSGELADTQDALTQQLSGLESPPHLAKRAVAMGMVPAPNAAFLRLSDGKVVGVAKKATEGEGFAVVSQDAVLEPSARPPRRPAETGRRTAPLRPARPTRPRGGGTPSRRPEVNA